MSNYLQRAAVQGFDTAFELLGLSKTAAQKARTVARERAANGDVEGATRIMQAPGVVNPNSSGVPYHTLGSGGEGVAELAMKPSLGNEPVVKKTFDPNATMYSPEMINRKAAIGPELNKNPAFAKFLGEGRTNVGTPIHYNEYVKGSPVRSAQLEVNPEAQKQYMSTALSAQRSGRATGHNLLDVRPANMLQTPDGQMKVIDHMPAKRDEMMSNADRRWQESPGHIQPKSERNMAEMPKGVPRAALPLTVQGNMNLFPNILHGDPEHDAKQALISAHTGKTFDNSRRPAPAPAAPAKTAPTAAGPGTATPAPAMPQRTAPTGVTPPAPAPAAPASAPQRTAPMRPSPAALPPAMPQATVPNRMRR